MFKLNPNPTFTVAVPLTVPGLPEPLEVSITFRHQNKTALANWVRQTADEDGTQTLHKVVVGWVGVQAEDGAEVPYSLTALTNLLDNYPAAQGEIFRAYLKELTEAKRKNS